MIWLILSFYVGAGFALFVQNIGMRRVAEKAMGERIRVASLVMAACIWPYVLWNADRNARRAAKLMRREARRSGWPRGIRP